MIIRKLEEKEFEEKKEDYEFLQEEIFGQDGTYEELFAYDNQEEEYLFEHNKRLNINKRRKHGLPPITPKASMKDLVTNFLFDHMWSELIDWSMNLIKDYAKYVHDKEFYYDVSNRISIPEQKLDKTPKIELTNENDKTITSNTGFTRPSIVQLKLFDTPVNTSSLLTLNSDKMSDKQSFTPAISRDNSILYQNRVASSNYETVVIRQIFFIFKNFIYYYSKDCQQIWKFRLNINNWRFDAFEFKPQRTIKNKTTEQNHYNLWKKVFFYFKI